MWEFEDVRTWGCGNLRMWVWWFLCLRFGGEDDDDDDDERGDYNDRERGKREDGTLAKK
jgi:hypothetical protein